MNTESDKIERLPLPPMEQIHRNPAQKVLDRLKLCAMIFGIYLFLSLLHIGCPIKAFTGISCPGCGMTRAVVAALRFHFKDAFYYHPLFLLTPLMFLLFLFDEFVPSKIKKVSWTIIIIAFIIVYFYRLLLTDSTVTTIDIRSGIVLKLLHHIIA